MGYVSSLSWELYCVCLWFLCATGLLVHPPTHSSAGGVIPMTIVAFITLKEGGIWGGCIPSFPFQNLGLACSPEQTHLQTVKPVPHVGEALLRGDVIHEHHPLRLSKQLSCEAVVPARKVSMKQTTTSRARGPPHTHTHTVLS